MSADDLKRLFQEAAEIAKAVPKELREAAFNRALDALSVPGAKKTERSGTHAQRARKTSAETPQDPTALLLSELDRTRHPEVAAAPRVLERALFVLRAARDDHSIDGLSAPQIAAVLTEKFRLRTTRQAVTQALDAAGNTVDRNASGRVAIYRLMHPGDEYLARGDYPASHAARGGATRKKSTKKNTDKSETKEEEKKKRVTPRKAESTKKAPSRSRRPGPGEMLRDLVQAGFFAQPRTIGDIQDHAQHSLAHSYGLNELSTPLRRAIHNSLLVRTQNSDGQYEYSVP